MNVLLRGDHGQVAASCDRETLRVQDAAPLEPGHKIWVAPEWRTVEEVLKLPDGNLQVLYDNLLIIKKPQTRQTFFAKEIGVRSFGMMRTATVVDPPAQGSMIVTCDDPLTVCRVLEVRSLPNGDVEVII